jgi:hypothetical protein
VSTTDDGRLDLTVERIGRRIAARTTRRSFLDRMAKVAVLVAGGPALATLLTEQAEARVCGQSGVTGKCPTFDCNGPGDVWGWCWYASPGCCSNGGLKKICDCCRVDYPNVHGYCPSGTNVRCIVESCLADPRVLAKPALRATGGTAASVAVARSRLRPAGRGTTVVIGEAHSPLHAAMAGPVAAFADGSLLLTDNHQITGGVADEIRRLGARGAYVCGPHITNAVDTQLRQMGLTVERTHASTDPATASVQTAQWVLARTRSRRVYCVATNNVGSTIAPIVAAVAGAAQSALVLGPGAARMMTHGDAATVAYLIGSGAAEHAGTVAGAFPLGGSDPTALARGLSDLLIGPENRRNLTLNLLPAGTLGVAGGLAGSPGAFLLHPDSVLGGDVYRWILANRGTLDRAVAGATLGSLGNAGMYDLQSSLNAFDTHFLQGVAGQGLPVIPQPLAERDLGRARIAGAPERTEVTSGSYWSGRANPNR